MDDCAGEHRGQHVLHQRHHREPKGCRVQPPQHVLAHLRSDDGRFARCLRSRCDLARRSHVSCQRLGPRARSRCHGCQLGLARGRSVGQSHRRSHREREGHRRRGSSDHLDERPSRVAGSRHEQSSLYPLRRIRGTTRAQRGIPRGDRTTHIAGMGNDGDEPDRCGEPALEGRTRAARRRTGRSAHERRCHQFRRRLSRGRAGHYVARAVGWRDQWRTAMRRLVDCRRLLRRRPFT